MIFFEPGIKDTDWSVTSEVTGVDGKVRRWVYLHYFKEGQPSLNWLDPTFAAQQLIIGDALHAIDVTGARVLRLDANGFLGVERRAEGTAGRRATRCPSPATSCSPGRSARPAASASRS